MIQTESKVKIIDNTGAKRIKCIRVLGGYKKRYAHIGDIISASVIKAAPRASIKKGVVVHVVIVRTKKETRRKDGTYIKFDDNAGVVIDKEKKEPQGTRIFSVVARELRNRGFNSIISLAPEVL